MDLAREFKTRLTMHLLETREESDWLRGRGGTLQAMLESRGLATGDQQPTDIDGWYTQTNTFDSGGALLAHMNYADDADIQRVAASGASVVWCPRAHDYFGHRDHSWQRFIDAGVNVCIGTDSLASNETLSVLDELRFVAAQSPQCGPSLLLRCGTINAARGLQMSDQIGAIELGKRADLVAIDWDDSAPDDVSANVIHGSGAIRATWIDGESVFQQR